MFEILHLDIQKAPRTRCRKDIQNNLFPLRDTETEFLVEGESQGLDFVIALQFEHAVQEILQRIFAVKEFLEGGIQPGIEIGLVGKHIVFFIHNFSG